MNDSDVMEYQARAEALRIACAAHDLTRTEDIVQRAEAYFAFLMGRQNTGAVK